MLEGQSLSHFAISAASAASESALRPSAWYAIGRPIIFQTLARLLLDLRQRALRIALQQQRMPSWRARAPAGARLSTVRNDAIAASNRPAMRWW
jgi:hypothetical protein